MAHYGDTTATIWVKMDIWQADKMFLFIAFVIPGFISIKCYQLFHPGIVRNAADQIVDAIAYSCINYSLFLWLIFAVEGSALREVHPLLYGMFYVLVLLVGPVIWASVWKWMRSWQVFQKNAPHPTAKPWDFVFQQRKPYWIIVHLKAGRTLGGLYGTRSFASSAPAPEQIYLEQEWIVENGALIRAVNSSAGVLVSGSEIAHIEFRQY